MKRSLALLWMIPALLGQGQGGDASADPGPVGGPGFEPWDERVRLEPGTVLGPLGFSALHVQGLVATESHFFFTSVNPLTKQGWISKVRRPSLQLELQRELTFGTDFHPGGMDLKELLWVPVAAYSPKSHARIVTVNPEDLSVQVRFEVEDHIGAVARDGGRVIGATWDAEEFYVWDLEGKLLETRKNPTGVAYQDCKAISGHLMCCGGDVVDWIDLETWQLKRRFPVGRSMQGHSLSREGVSLLGDRLFLMPDDGLGCRFYEFRLVQ